MDANSTEVLRVGTKEIMPEGGGREPKRICVADLFGGSVSMETGRIWGQIRREKTWRRQQFGGQTACLCELIHKYFQHERRKAAALLGEGSLERSQRVGHIVHHDVQPARSLLALVCGGVRTHVHRARRLCI